MMIQTAFRRPIPASRGPRTLAAAALAALALSACGGGGGGSGGIFATGGGGPGALGRSSSPRAGGVIAGISYSSGAMISISKGGHAWTRDADNEQSAPSGWAAETKVDAPAGSTPTELFRVVTNIDGTNNADYLAYGYWSDYPVDGIGTGDFKPFYHGNMLYAGNVRQQTGTATYTGGATGLYRLNPAGGSTSADGRFTADVTIEANFGTNVQGASLRFGLSTIETVSDGITGGLVDTSDAVLTADVTGPGFTGEGLHSGAQWGGRFFGPGGQKPTGIAGWFEKVRANVSGGGGYASLNGVFGADR